MMHAPSCFDHVVCGCLWYVDECMGKETLSQALRFEHKLSLVLSRFASGNVWPGNIPSHVAPRDGGGGTSKRSQRQNSAI